LTELLQKLTHIKSKIRLTSLEPPLSETGFFDALKSLKNFVPHFHLPLQSGDDKVLADMKRNYTSTQFLATVAKVRQVFPTAVITGDVICGYPTEDESAFLNTLSVIKQAKFDDLHVFGFSPRADTAAALLKPLHGSVVKERVARAIKTKSAPDFEI
jgi:threonylcarbamoyladenosine tRNA methylthiotransferase MtaB